MVTDDAVFSGSMMDALLTECVSDNAADSMIQCIGCALLSVITPQSNCTRNGIEHTADTTALFDCSTCHGHNTHANNFTLFLICN